MIDPAIERWLPVVGYEGYYEVSDRGRVRSLPRLTRKGNLQDGRILRPSGRKSGYRRVDLWVNGVGRTHLVHGLMMEAFAGPRPEGMEIRHLDGNPGNNYWPGNLAYGTRSENQQDTVRHGRHRNASKTHCDSGHEFIPENTYDNHGGRGCRQCHREVSLAWLRRNKGKVKQ